MSAAEALHVRWSAQEPGRDHALFVAEGMHCANCARSIERAVRALPGVDGVSVSTATARVAVDWRTGATSLADILAAVERAGFGTVPLSGRAASNQLMAERRAALKRLGLASLGMMQAMMYLGALYGASDISGDMAALMRISGMIIVTPVLFYSGAPFLLGAWRDLRNRRPGMDVPVAIALLLAWVPSVVHTFTGHGEVYFDSVGMFVFFLSAGRFVEMSVRHRALVASEALAGSLPAQVTRLGENGAREKIATSALAPGDRFLVPKGTVVAVDAELVDAGSSALLDESLLTGESTAVRRVAGERLRGGSVNVGEVLTLRALASIETSTLAGIVALLERAQGERPRIAKLADRAASVFVVVILALAVLTAAAWWFHDPSRAFPAALAVLVVTCPCALSLATPAALAAATNGLARLGLLVTRADAIERLARVDTVVLDKTGTLTGGSLGISAVEPLSTLTRAEVLAIAAALERGSAHPLASAFAEHENQDVHAEAIVETPGVGIEGRVAGTVWRLGKRAFAEGASGRVRTLLPNGSEANVFLGRPAGLVAGFRVTAALRAEARDAVEGLRRMGLGVVLASGDSRAAVAEVARDLDIRHPHSRLTPEEKLDLLRELRSRGRCVFAIGDGINDGPVLAAADVSCAMGQGSAVAHAASDLLLASESLAVLPRAVALARRSLRIVRQNLVWALAYNLAAVPLAALGMIPAWLAALGMSLSSAGVVLNARRLASVGRAP